MFLRKLKAYWLLKGRKQRQQQREEQRNLQQELHAKLIGDNLYSFHGGLSLHYGKNFTSNQPVYLLQNPELFLISAVQHKGDKALITVAEQDTVTAGQALTSQVAPNDLAVHSPVNGKVVGILDYLYAAPLQKTCATIVVQATGRNHTLGWPTQALERLTAERQAWQQEQKNLEAGLGNDAADLLITQAVDRRAMRDFQIAELPERLGLGGVTWSEDNQAQATWARILDFSQGTPIGPASLQPLDCYTATTKELLLQIKLAGIAGLGGAVFPTERKINRRAFKTLLVNAAECEPYITCDDALMQHYSQELVLSWLCMQRVLQCENIVVAIEDDKQVAHQALTESLKLAISLLEQRLREVRGQRSVDSSLHSFFTEQSAEFFANKDQLNQRKLQQEQFLCKILGQSATNWNTLNKDQQIELLEARLKVLQGVRIRVLPTKYPSGNQRTTIEVLTGYSLSKRQNFTSLGAICLNVATVYSCYRAITFGEVLTQRLVTITGLGIAQPGNYWLPFGITPAYLAEKLGTTPGFTGKVIIGGPMMGYPLDDLNTPINKATNCMIFVSQDEVANYPRLFAEKNEQACIRCTACQDHCPILLQPQQLYWFSKNKDDKKLVKANLSACIECGLCDYVCPSEIPLVSYFQESKTRIYQAREKERNAAEARVRFERKEARETLEREQREAKRAADKARNQERAASMRAKTMAETGIDPVAAAKARLAARGVETGRTIVQEAGATAPDNSAIMEQRRQRRLAKQAEQNAATNATPENSGTVPLDRSAVLAAVNRAKAKQAAAQAATAAPANVSEAPAPTHPARAVPQNIQEQIARAKARQAAQQGEAAPVAQTATPVSEATPAAPRRAIPQNIQEQIARAKAKQAQAQADTSPAGNESVSDFLALGAPAPQPARPQRAIPQNIQEQIARAKAKQAAAQASQTQESVDAVLNLESEVTPVAPTEAETTSAVELTASSYQMPIAQAQPRRVNPRVAEAVARAKAKQAERNGSASTVRSEQGTEQVATPTSKSQAATSTPTPVMQQSAAQEAFAQALASSTPKRVEPNEPTTPKAKRPVSERVASIVARAKAKQAPAAVDLSVFPTEDPVREAPRMARPSSLGDILGLEEEQESAQASSVAFPPQEELATAPAEFFMNSAMSEQEEEPNPLDLIISSGNSRPRTFVPDTWESVELESARSAPRVSAPQFVITDEMRSQYEQQREAIQLGGVNPRSRNLAQNRQGLSELFAEEEEQTTSAPTPMQPAPNSRQAELLAQRQARIAAIAARAKANHQQRSKENR